MALTALALCSRALLRLGAQPVASLDEGTAEAEVAANLYAPVRDGLLSAHPWSFATGQAALPRLAAAPHADLAHAFQLPPGFLRALSAGSGGRGRGTPCRTGSGCRAPATSAISTPAPGWTTKRSSSRWSPTR
jgi:hypothetical protein